MCPRCKENHGYDLKTKDHNVVLYCNRNPIEYYTEQDQKDIVHTIRSDTLFYTQVLLRKTKADVKTCNKEFSLFQSDISKRARRLKDRLDNVLRDVDFKHRCLNQKRKIYSLIFKIQRYEQTKYEYSANKPIQFLRNKNPQIMFSPSLTIHTNQFYMKESLNKEDGMESLIPVQVTESGTRRVENDNLLKLMSEPEILYSFDLSDVEFCTHISYVTTDRVWVSDHKNLILINTGGDSLHDINSKILNSSPNGVHTVSSVGEMIYVDRNYNINKLSKDMKTTTTFIERTDFTWRSQCVYWSPFSGDILVGMCMENLKKGKVIRYNQAGQLKQTIQHDDTGLELYKKPSFLTENNNGDVVVSDCHNGVVVTDCRGRLRFSYSITPSGSELVAFGVCSDALSNILV